VAGRIIGDKNISAICPAGAASLPCGSSKRVQVLRSAFIKPADDAHIGQSNRRSAIVINYGRELLFLSAYRITSNLKIKLWPSVNNTSIGSRVRGCWCKSGRLGFGRGTGWRIGKCIGRSISLNEWLSRWCV